MKQSDKGSQALHINRKLFELQPLSLTSIPKNPSKPKGKKVGLEVLPPLPLGVE